MEHTSTLFSELSDATQLLGVAVGIVVAAATIVGIVTLFETEYTVLFGLLLFAAVSTVGFALSVGLKHWARAAGMPNKSKVLVVLTAGFAVVLFASQFLLLGSSLQIAASLFGFIGLGATAGMCTILACSNSVTIARARLARRQAAR